jgi:hypothetical protein
MNTLPEPDALNVLCTQLFESFCEHRRVLPLAYLMHVWPLMEDSEAGLGMLRQSLLDLSEWHADEIDPAEYLLISQIVSTLAISDGAVAEESEHRVAWTLETCLPGTRH